MDDTSGIPLNGITKSVLHVRMDDTRQRFEGRNLKLHPSVFPRLRLGDVSGRTCRSSFCGDVTGFAWWRFRKIFHNRQLPTIVKSAPSPKRHCKISFSTWQQNATLKRIAGDHALCRKAKVTPLVYWFKLDSSCQDKKSF